MTTFIVGLKNLDDPLKFDEESKFAEIFEIFLKRKNFRDVPDWNFMKFLVIFRKIQRQIFWRSRK